jgi:LacI family repressor for deo operon, udp, cdd, tsx, nupC, and nupG
MKTKPPTIIDVARLANVSTTTVSFVLNKKPGVTNKTRATVIQAMHELKYQPNAEARRLARSQRKNQERSKTGVILFLTYEKSSDYVTLPMFERDYLEGILDAAERFGYKLMIGRTGVSKDYDLNTRNIEADGIITNIMVAKVVTALSDVCPVVLLASFLKEGGISSVIADNQGGIRQAVKHLVELGHCRIGFMNSELAHPCYCEREIGYKTALAEHGLDCEPELIGEGCNLDAYLAHKPLPTAMVCTNDSLASKVIRKLSTMNIKIPDQISITGFDDLDIAEHTSPPLTTVHVPREKLAALAVEHLIQIINNPQVGNYRITVPVKLVLRQSTGRCRSNDTPGT